MLRNYLHYNLYDQAEKLSSKSTFPEMASNNEWARYLYYTGPFYNHQLLSLWMHTPCGRYLSAYSTRDCFNTDESLLLSITISSQRTYFVLYTWILSSGKHRRTSLYQPNSILIISNCLNLIALLFSYRSYQGCSTWVFRC